MGVRDRNGQTGRQAGRQTTDRQTGRQAGRQTEGRERGGGE